jgi:hypothetical protein
MQSRQILARSVDSFALACAFACTWACSSMLGIEDTEPPRVRMRVKPPSVGERGAVGSAASDDRRACRPPRAGPAVLAVTALAAGPKALARVFGRLGDSGRAGAGLESNRIVLGMAAVSSWAMMMRQSRGYSRSISGRGPSWPLPGVGGAA